MRFLPCGFPHSIFVFMNRGHIAPRPDRVQPLTHCSPGRAYAAAFSQLQLHLQDHGQNHRSALCFFPEIVIEAILDRVLVAVPVSGSRLLALKDGVFRDSRGSRHQVIGLFDVDEAARSDLRSGKQPAAAGFEGEGNDHDTVLRQVLAVPQDHISDISHSEAVDKNVADLNLLADRRSVLADFEHVSGAQQKDIFFFVAKFTHQLCLCLEVAEFTVYRDRVLGLYQVIDQLDIFLAGVAGRVDVLGDDIRPFQHQLVDDACDRLLVARDGAGRENDRVIGADRDLAVHAVSHAAQGRHALALAAGRDYDRFIPGIVFELIDIDQGVLGNIEDVEFCRSINDVDHAAAFDNDLASVFICVVDDLLDTVHIGGEGRHNEPGIRTF